jgi:hypothetical protein
MCTLQQIVDQAGGGVAATGQTSCYEVGAGMVVTVIACAGTSQDGEYRLGATAVARFTDNGDGTVTDNLTGLIWLTDASCFGQSIWTTALSDANSLAASSDACVPDLTDGSVAGDWRLPNFRELHSLIDYQTAQPALPSGHPFSGVESNYYWTSTTTANDQVHAWVVIFHSGNTTHVNKVFPQYVWPVRAGP